jgi:hypothetical protein
MQMRQEQIKNANYLLEAYEYKLAVAQMLPVLHCL